MYVRIDATTTRLRPLLPGVRRRAVRCTPPCLCVIRRRYLELLMIAMARTPVHPRGRRAAAALAAAIVMATTSAARAQGNGKCPVDISKVSLGPIGAACGQGADACGECICTIARELHAAGYAVTGPDQVPLEECAAENLQPLLGVGVSVGTLLQVIGIRV